LPQSTCRNVDIEGQSFPGRNGKLAGTSTFLACLSVSFGCGAGTELNQLVTVDPVSDAAPATWIAGEGASFQDPFSGAPPFSTQMGTDSHNAGHSCIEAACHGSVAAAESFLIGGTVYADYKGTMPAAGVEVRVADSAGHTISTYSGPEGNFYITSASAGNVTFPAVVGARTANSTRPMITTLTVSMGSCGQTPCHVPGGSPIGATGNYYPIHVP
jgi:hypothetical protein